MLHIIPWTLMLMLHIRQSIYLVLTNVLSASFLIVHIRFDEISLQFRSTNISLLYIYWANLSLPELHRQCCADLNQHNTVCTILVKIDVLNTCGAMICSYFGIVFLLLFKKIENAVYTCFQNSMLLFINGFIFDIMNIQNNQSLEFEWVPMLAPLLDLWIIEGFHGFVMLSLSLSKIGWIRFSNAKEMFQKMLARKCLYRHRGKP